MFIFIWAYYLISEKINPQTIPLLSILLPLHRLMFSLYHHLQSLIPNLNIKKQILIMIHLNQRFNSVQLIRFLLKMDSMCMKF